MFTFVPYRKKAGAPLTPAADPTTTKASVRRRTASYSDAVVRRNGERGAARASEATEGPGDDKVRRPMTKPSGRQSSSAKTARRASRTIGLAAEADVARGAGRPRSQEARARILEAALDLLEERGLRALTIEAIAEHAGTSKVTLYRWWPNKAAIVLEAILAEVSPSMPYRKSESPLESLRDQMRSFARFLNGRSGRLLVGIVAQGALDEETGRAYREHWVKPRRADARKLLGRAIEAGELPEDVDVEATLCALFGPLYYRFIVQHDTLSPAFAESVFRSVMLGVASPEARKRLTPSPQRKAR
jgi:AcrR family transcriptional regulator